MMRVASRITSPSGREALDTSTVYRGTGHESLNYLLGNSLQRTLGEFREHHRTCSARRRGAAAFEAKMESQRTDFLAKKYIESVRQDPIGLVTSSSTNHSSSSTGTSTINTSMSSSTAAGTGKSDETKEVDMNRTNLTHSPKLEVTSPIQKPLQNAMTKDKGSKDVTVKTEPHSNRDLNSCSQVQTLSGSSRSSVGGGGSITRSSSAGKIKSRPRQTSKDFIQRSLSLSQNTPKSRSTSDNDSENDLTFTADDAYRLGTPLKPLEEDTTIPSALPPKIRSPPLSSSTQSVQTSSSTATSSGSLSSVATPTCTSSTSTPTAPSTGNASLMMELDAFSKVMNQVERNEKAKERRASCPNNPCVISQPPQSQQQQSMVESSPHLISPPPYSINGVYPQVGGSQSYVMSSGQYTPTHLQSCFDSRTMYQPQMDTYDSIIRANASSGIHGNTGGSIHGNTGGMHGGNPDSRYCQVLTSSSDSSSCRSPHLQLQHPTTHSTHSQIGALLQSPITQSSPFDSLNHTYQPPMPSPVLSTTPYASWESQGVGGGVGMSQPVLDPRVGQKRSSLSTMYMPHTKIAHSTVSHMPSSVQMSTEPLPHFPSHPGTMGTPHISPYPHGANFSHMS